MGAEMKLMIVGAITGSCDLDCCSHVCLLWGLFRLGENPNLPVVWMFRNLGSWIHFTLHLEAEWEHWTTVLMWGVDFTDFLARN